MARPAGPVTMRIALSGTPGVGKSTLADLLRQQGETVIDLNAWASAHNAVIGADADGTKVIDTDAIDIGAFPTDCFIDSHMSHVLGVDAVWLVRLDPHALRPRLEARGYSASKVQENLEAEAMDLILQEALAHCDVVVQRDGTHRSPKELLASFGEARTEALKSSDIEPVDWSDSLLDGF